MQINKGLKSLLLIAVATCSLAVFAKPAEARWWGYPGWYGWGYPGFIAGTAIGAGLGLIGGAALGAAYAYPGYGYTAGYVYPAAYTPYSYGYYPYGGMYTYPGYSLYTHSYIIP